MKQFFAFYGDCYYPFGGINDFIGSYHTKEEAIKAIEEKHLHTRPDDINFDWSWCHIWDCANEIEVYTK